jgi:hypothetical protein
MLKKRKLCLYAICILAALLVCMFVWKDIAVRNRERTMEAQRAKLLEKAQQAITSKTRDLLRLTTIPLAWAVRREMINENYGQINEYLNKFVKEPGIRQILVVKSDGTIAVSTDKKMEGAPLSSLFPQELIEQKEISISDDGKGNIRAVTPIMGLDARLGLLIMIYEPERINIGAAP